MLYHRLYGPSGLQNKIRERTAGTVPKGLIRGLGELEIEGWIEISTVDIGQNTEKSRGDSGRLANTQTPEKNHQLTLM